MNAILSYIQEWFLQKEEYFVAFSQADSRVESWFKAEVYALQRSILIFGGLRPPFRMVIYEVRIW